ncbi:MAG: undecaprenyldiphospho-muramoylpentapeptide beta-N-acetylglucosaminyltransferase [Candidatus Amulumruptor caecigallinarius]|nr:undecaprenyldiphospho-muramoylpentapeptide beta-N-acetylglucosaminyltransferase [Candidatus Amulumruptor caecigallinarius]MCM1396477.1 undecaprenyldiphospho-muramoylpentapeptide beta-N-acetylglucosaminyltransferase [Candidatus Amulumruptor caecigallinarius]MCM1453466.1 undecaprenyldiphospho-muramoylpentapeptide beta-N-acetylglucosaminyltransferase [bacterium]
MSKPQQPVTANAPYRILVSGGGTGGHIFPALAIANELKRRYPDADIRFVGAADRMEMERVPDAGYPIQGLPVAGFDRRRLWRNFGVLLKLWRSSRMARRIVRDFHPDIAIGVGGYASGPTLKAAQQAGIPTLLQEQNSYAGVTNKLLAKGAKRICVAYDGMERFFPADKIVKTGNPVRKALMGCTLTPEEARVKLGFPADEPLVVVVGGSLGARSVNNAVFAALDRIEAAGANILWQTGKIYIDEFRAKTAGRKRLRVEAFLPDMATVYRAATFVISRAGASTISELQDLGVPAILIPSANVAEDHQRKNALALVQRDAAEMILDADATAQLADKAVALLADPQRRDRYAANVKAMALTRADEKIADAAVELIEANRRNNP